MKKVLILHGIYGSPQENWFPWLKKELENENIEVIIPHLPTKEPLAPEDWWEAFKEYESKVDKDTIIVGHSLGVAFALKIIEKHPVHAAFLVAPAWGKTDNEFTPVMKAVADQVFDWEKIKQNCPSFTVFYSDNDPYLTIDHGKNLTKSLNAKEIFIPGGGHLNASAGYTEFPILLAKIKLNLL